MGLFSSETQTEQTVEPMRPGQVRDWQNRYFELSQAPFEMFPEQMYADLTPEQEAALQGRMGVAEGFTGGIMDPTMAAWGTTLTSPDVAANPYVNAMLERQREGIMGSLSEDILPMIRSRAIGAGQLGSSRQGVAEGLAAEGALEALADAQAQTQLGAYGQGLGQQRFGIGAAPGMASLQMTPSDIMMGVGGVRRAEDQRAIDEAMQRHQFAQEEPWARLERFVGPYQAMSSPYGTTTTTGSTDPSALQIAGQLGGAALMGASGAGALGFGPMAGMFSGAGGAGGAGGQAPGSMMPAMMGTMAANQIPGMGTRSPTAGGMFPSRWNY